MDPMTILSLLSFAIKETPEAIALFGQVKNMVMAGRDPTPQEWATLIAQASAAHLAVQSA